MNRTLKNIFLILLAVVIAGAVVYAFKKEAKGPDASAPDNSALSQYFAERLTSLGVKDIGQPIEGFDANLLILAFPGILPSDFNGVQTLEGYYQVGPNDEIAFVRGEGQSVSSAERMVSEEGYAALLDNLSARLQFPIGNKTSIDELIFKLNTGERIETSIDEGASALGVKVIPHEVLEDSRCPVQANCIQAGTIRVRTTLESGLGAGSQIFELDKPITTEAEEVTLIQVSPIPELSVSIDPEDYVFYFQIRKRDPINL
jgi:hypothetical protein